MNVLFALVAPVVLAALVRFWMKGGTRRDPSCWGMVPFATGGILAGAGLLLDLGLQWR